MPRAVSDGAGRSQRRATDPPKESHSDAVRSTHGCRDQRGDHDHRAPGWFVYKEGDTAAFISIDVASPDGCKAGREVVNCVAFLPIVVDDPVDAGNNRQLWCIGFAPPYITAPGPNVHWGKLMRDYLVADKGEDGTLGVGPALRRPHYDSTDEVVFHPGD
jgi:hypothetical protein